MSDLIVINCDGACSGNPGPAGIGFVIRRGNEKIKDLSKAIGSATNNIAEYTALIYALQEALKLRLDNLKVITDSELIYKQVTGQYKIKNENMKFLFDMVEHLVQGFEKIEFEHVLRDKNIEADKLASSAIRK